MMASQDGECVKVNPFGAQAPDSGVTLFKTSADWGASLLAMGVEPVKKKKMEVVEVPAAGGAPGGGDAIFAMIGGNKVKKSPLDQMFAYTKTGKVGDKNLIPKDSPFLKPEKATGITLTLTKNQMDHTVEVGIEIPATSLSLKMPMADLDWMKGDKDFLAKEIADFVAADFYDKVEEVILAAPIAGFNAKSG